MRPTAPHILLLLINVLSALGRNYSAQNSLIKWICPIVPDPFLSEIRPSYEHVPNVLRSIVLRSVTPVDFTFIGLCERQIHLNRFTASAIRLALPRPHVSLPTLKASIMNAWNECANRFFRLSFATG